ncbi:MAG: hypothetical protein ACYST5_08055 [Planctomycetota bacterium]|jgi:hypothetical protein
MGKEKLTKQGIIKEWKELDSKSSKKWVGLNALCQKMGIKRYHVQQLFLGEDLTKVKLRHGIRTSPQETPLLTDQLLEKYDSVVSKYKKIPTWIKVRVETGIPNSTFVRRFKTTNDLKQDVVKAYQKWLKKYKPKSRNLKVVDKWLQGQDKQAVSRDLTTKTSKRRPQVYEKTKGRTYGVTLAFRNLINEPTNEQGVVFLFGMVSEELGFSAIEYVGTDCPDCEAKRLVDRRRRQQRVQIEFEYKSREFESHGHDPQNCDLIVCWKHNWKDCPVDVVELSEEIKKLQSTKKLVGTPHCVWL